MIQNVEHRRDNFLVSTDKSKLDLDVIHRFLTDSYWSPGIPRHIVEKAIENSLCFGVYDGNAQVGFARVVTDYATYAYLADVFILESHRGRGLSKWMMECVMAHPELQGLRRWMLATRDAHGLYSQFGFEHIEDASRLMHIARPNIYRENKEGKS